MEGSKNPFAPKELHDSNLVEGPPPFVAGGIPPKDLTKLPPTTETMTPTELTTFEIGSLLAENPNVAEVLPFTTPIKIEKQIPTTEEMSKSFRMLLNFGSSMFSVLNLSIEALSNMGVDTNSQDEKQFRQELESFFEKQGINQDTLKSCANSQDKVEEILPKIMSLLEFTAAKYRDKAAA